LERKDILVSEFDFGHAKIAIMGQSTMEENINETMNWLNRRRAEISGVESGYIVSEYLFDFYRKKKNGVWIPSFPSSKHQVTIIPLNSDENTRNHDHKLAEEVPKSKCGPIRLWIGF
jgi:hypothetical protein